MSAEHDQTEEAFEVLLTSKEIEVLVDALEGHKVKLLEEAMSFSKKKLSYKKDLQDVGRFGRERLNASDLAKSLQERFLALSKRKG